MYGDNVTANYKFINQASHNRDRRVGSLKKSELIQKTNIFLSGQGFEKNNSFIIKGNDEIKVTFKRKTKIWLK